MFIYLIIVLHALMIFLTRRLWQRRKLAWTTLDTAFCVVMPFAMVLLWMLAAAAIPIETWFRGIAEPWDEIIGLMIVFLLPLVGFWVSFLWFGLRPKIHGQEAVREGLDSKSP
jgi:hypothetical protein